MSWVYVELHLAHCSLTTKLCIKKHNEIDVSEISQNMFTCISDMYLVQQWASDKNLFISQSLMIIVCFKNSL